MTPEQNHALEVAERVCSVLSLIGTSIIIVTFLGSNLFRKPINRLVFYASWGNIMSNVATLISVAGYVHGSSSALCQFQAFLIQWFMPADALWAFAMSLNVYLTFHHKFDSTQLRKLEWKYLISCYGIPFIPAFIYFFVDTKTKGKVYGPAVLWCWVSLPWDVLRIATFYGPVWFILVVTFAIYIRVGGVIFEKRRQLQSANAVGSDYYVDNLFNDVAKVTEIHVTTEQVISSSQESTQAVDIVSDERRRPSSPNYIPYSIKIESAEQQEKEAIQMQPLRTHNISDVNFQRRVATIEANKAAWAYSKCAMLFFVALVITWVPSTVNRVYTLIYPDKESVGLDFASGVVLPLQGFWNGIIYVSVSWPSVKTVLSSLRQTPKSLKISRPFPLANDNLVGERRLRGKTSDSNESTSELAMHPQPEGLI